MEVMNILEGFDIKAMTESQRTHLLAETFKISLTDMETYFGDPDAVKSRSAQILSKDFAKQRGAAISMDKATPWTVEPDEPVSGTTHLVAADAEGNVACITNTRSSWGIARPAGRTGLYLHGGIRLLSANPKSTMFAKPGKRLQKSITPVMVFDGQQRLVFALGAAGGRTITHTNSQLLVNLLDLGMNVQQAISAPRVAYNGAGLKLIVSRRFSPQTIDTLRTLGHDIELGESGVAQAIGIDPRTRTYTGGADPRQHGGVAAY
jgi:gamma-glutamyltranspeptidase/glutathione hydrolase